MTAALVQGVPGVTLDVDLWIDLPERQYMRVINICHKLGARIWSPTVVELVDGTPINFLYQVGGLRSFATQWKKAVRVEVRGCRVKALTLESILRSKETVARDKDLADIPKLRTAIAARKIQRESK